MKFELDLAIKNIKGQKIRSAALIILAALLSCSLLSGSLIIGSLKNGLNSYSSRLGADIVVVPKEAGTGNIDSILLQGIPGYFYMDEDIASKIRNIEGVREASPQFYLASASSGCCDTYIQIIGFDPDTDFSIQPWIGETFGGTIGYGDVIVGSNITVPSSHSFRFYNVTCNASSRLAKTGSGLDSAVYANMDTIREMMKSSDTLGFDYFENVSPERAISSVMVKLDKGADINGVIGSINAISKDITVITAKDMISGISEGLEGVSSFIEGLIGIIWFFSSAILIVIFVMIVNERVKELAVLRVIGASKKMLSKVLISEAFLVSLSGGLTGIVLSLIVFLPFADSLKNSLQLPLLLPDGLIIFLISLAAILLVITVGGVASGICALRITGKDTALILREGA